MRDADGALFNTDEVFTAGQELVELVKRRALASREQCFRACLHRSTDEPVQEMIVASGRTATRPPHRHPGRTETHLILEGDVTVLLFDPTGAVTRRTDMGPPASGRPFCLRIGPDCWHMIVFKSDVVVYYEMMTGPYVADGTNVWADWGPARDDAGGIDAYLGGLGVR